MTSAELNKELKKLQHERTRILALEESSALFVAATTENAEELRPEYSLEEECPLCKGFRLRNDILNATIDGTTWKDLLSTSFAELEKKIREIKHQLSVFNSTYVIDELGMTIDEVLVFLPQQNERVDKLAQYARHPLRMRHIDRFGARTNMVEYEYANYSLDEANRLYNEASEELTKAQIALDRVNSTVEIA